MNYESWYETISAPFRESHVRLAMRAADRLLVYLFAAAFAIALCALIAGGDLRAVRFGLVPAIVFALVTVVRACINEQRPYESWNIDPVIPKNTQGKSMPSRHMASAVIISCAFAWLNPFLGAIGFVGCALVAFTRIVGGVHYPRDIVAATVISAVCGIVGFIFVP